MNSCAIGSLTYDYAYLLKNGRKEADSLFCKLSWLIYAKPVIDSYIPVGTLISDPGQNACGATNTQIGFAPFPPFYTAFQIDVLNYNGSPVTVGFSFTSILDAMDDVIAALTATTGVQWSYTQLPDVGGFNFLLCAPYTQNGDTVEATIEVFVEGSIGFLRMSAEMSGGIAPATPEYQTAEMNCISVAQFDEMVEVWNGFTCDVKCCDIQKPVTTTCESDNPTDSNIELREDQNLEEREDGN